MVSDTVYECCQPVLQDDTISEDDKADKLEGRKTLDYPARHSKMQFWERFGNIAVFARATQHLHRSEQQ